MSTVLLLLKTILRTLADLTATLLSAVAVRWIIGYSNPLNDWRAFMDFMATLGDLFVEADPLEDVNLAILGHLRERYISGYYQSDSISDSASAIVDCESVEKPTSEEVNTDDTSKHQ